MIGPVGLAVHRAQACRHRNGAEAFEETDFLRRGIRGFYIFLACIALGTGAIAAVNSVSQSITDKIDSQGQELMAGDVRFELNN
ncbi:hypothetical protein ACC687_37835, partial [Rhizobium ruizarguesonis]